MNANIMKMQIFIKLSMTLKVIEGHTSQQVKVKFTFILIPTDLITTLTDVLNLMDNFCPCLTLFSLSLCLVFLNDKSNMLPQINRKTLKAGLL